MEATRTAGYVTDVPYVPDCFGEHAPSWLNYIAALNGFQTRRLDREFTYIDLGCGFGQTLNACAAAYKKGKFFGVDFNSTHIDEAKRQADAWGCRNVSLINASIADLPGISLPQFDFIIVHGVYSWVSDDVRHAIHAFVRDRLKPGGVLHLSYNCMPGWAEVAPVQKLAFELAEAFGSDSLTRFAASSRQLADLAEIPSSYLHTNKVARRRVDQMGRLDQSYAAHEYLNANWRAFYSLDVLREMSAIGLDYAGSGVAVENHPALMLRDASETIVASQPTEGLRQMVGDFVLNRGFRRDIYVRSGGRAPKPTQLRSIHFVQPLDLRELLKPVEVPRGRFHVQRGLARELKAAFATGSLSLDELIARIPSGAASAEEIQEAVTYLVAGARLLPAVKAHVVSGGIAAGRIALSLDVNRIHISQGVSAAPGGISELLERRIMLVSPVAGNVFILDGLYALILKIRIDGASSRAAILRAVQNWLRESTAGRDASAGPEENMLRAAVKTVNDTLLPSLERLGIVGVG